MTVRHRHGIGEQAIIDEFFYVVNMPIASLERWLATPESKAVAGRPGSDGQRVVELMHKRTADYTAEDVEDMRKVVRSVHHQLAERPVGDVHDSPWRHELMNRGHDPLTGRHHP
jgi:hypothetical protein